MSRLSLLVLSEIRHNTEDTLTESDGGPCSSDGAGLVTKITALSCDYIFTTSDWFVTNQCELLMDFIIVSLV